MKPLEMIGVFGWCVVLGFLVAYFYTIGNC
jgi:hypothetical protein